MNRAVSGRIVYDPFFRAEQEIYGLTAAPLLKRAVEGRTGVIFAFGQTGSGKTHTMNHVMDNIAAQLFSSSEAPPTITFSYLEILGNNLSDGLRAPTSPADTTAEEVFPPKMGEVEGGRVELSNLTEHVVTSAELLLKLIEKAKAQRRTAATEQNDASSRSHGVALFTIGEKGRLYVIDLAGSESAKDVKGHNKQRMEETKQINV